MVYRISEEKINEVRNASDIVDIVSAYLTLKKSGKNYFGLCPFHTEKTPSFSVNPALQIFHCFGCNAGGNVFTFIMKMDAINFPTAVRRLAQRAGIHIPEEHIDEEMAKTKESLYFANRLAAEFYYRNLTGAELGTSAKKYLHDRGLDLGKLGKFGLGYAPPAWDGLIVYAASKAVKAETLHKAGLVIPRQEKGGYYDRFRNRIMFPVFDVMGRIVGFGGRRLEKDSTAKYINSPETIIYKKSQILYGLYQAKESIRDKDTVILVEGYTDLLSLFQHSVSNVVATSGTAFTEEQAALVRRYTTNIIILFDADSAGVSAAVRSADILISRGLDVRVSRLPKGDDPDSFIRKRGAEKLNALVASPETLVNFKITSLKRAGFFKTPEKKARAIRTVLDSIAKIPDEIKRNLVAQEAAEIMEIDQRLLLGELEKIRRQPKRDYSEIDKRNKSSATELYQKPSKTSIAEETLLKYMLKNEKAMGFIFKHLTADNFSTASIREIIVRMSSANTRGDTFDATKVPSFYTDPRIAEIIAASLSEKEDSEELSEREAMAQEVKDDILALLRHPLEEKIGSLRKQIKEIQSSKKDVSKLIQEYQQLRNEMEKLDLYWEKQ